MANAATSCFLVLFCGLMNSAYGSNNFIQRRDVTDGQVFPETVSAIAGQTVYLRVLTPTIDQIRCTYRSPGTDIDVEINSDHIIGSRIKSWAVHLCGIVIENVTVSDTGSWRLTSWQASNVLSRGIGTLFVQGTSSSIDEVNLILSPNQDNELLLTPNGTRYCYVLRPNQTKIGQYPYHKQCQLPKLDNELDANGVWKLVAGVDGQTEELKIIVNIVTQVEKLLANVHRDDLSNEMRFSCNISNPATSITFCRFVRLKDHIGFNLEPGLGNQRYRYYGSGFKHGECGMNIINPTEDDYGTWICYVGSGDFTTVGSIIEASPNRTLSNEIDASDVFAINNTSVNLLCTAVFALDYCWFSSPSGLRISVSAKSNKSKFEGRYTYFGTGLNLGECGLTIRSSNLNDSGVWQCHLGTRASRAGFEVSRTIVVRISESQLMATKQSIDVIENVPFDVECTSVPVGSPIQYCRFVMPDGRGFSIDEDVTIDNALDGTYYFVPDRHMRLGFCAVSILASDPLVHSGQWTCAGRLVGWPDENSDDIQVNVSAYSMSEGAVIGLSFGIVVLLAAVFALVAYCFRRRQQLIPQAYEEPGANPAVDDTSF